MPVLGGHKKHVWSDQTIKKEIKNTTYEGYTLENDIAGQLINEDSIKDVCPIDESYFQKLKRKHHFVNKFMELFK